MYIKIRELPATYYLHIFTTNEIPKLTIYKSDRRLGYRSGGQSKGTFTLKR